MRVSCSCLFLAAAAFISSTIISGQAQDASHYIVDDLALGARVHFGSKAYKEYHCVPSETYPGFTWCQKKENDSERRGDFTAWYSILHDRDGTVVYVNRYQEPAYWSDDEINSDIRYYTRKIGQQPRNVIRMPTREGLPIGVIATWGDISVEPIDSERRSIVASGKHLDMMMVDLIGDYTRSAQQNLPLYLITNGPGFVWVATKKNTKGTLRFTALNPSLFYPTLSQRPGSTSQQSQATPHEGASEYAKVGWWTIHHRIVGNLNGCVATSDRDQTHIEVALIQSSPSKIDWTIFLSNPLWHDWVSAKRQHTLTLDTTKKWHGTMSVTSSNVLWSSVSKDFIVSLADARSMEIITEQGKELVSLGLKDSADAIKAVANCVREHPYVAAPASEAGQEPEQEPELSGTGFFVAPNWLVTNAHVVKDCRQNIEVKKLEQASHYAYVNGQDDTNDIALLRTDLTSTSIASFRNKPRVGERVATYGFPYKDLLSSSGNFTSGEVTAPTGMNDDTRFVQISTPIQPGNSGGPLLDMSGNVVGMVVAQLNATVMMKVGNSIPQNVNFAIRSPIITNFLSIKGISPKIASSGEGLLRAPPDVYEVAKDFTVQVFCKGAPRSTTSKNQPSGWGPQ